MVLMVLMVLMVHMVLMVLMVLMVIISGVVNGSFWFVPLIPIFRSRICFTCKHNQAHIFVQAIMRLILSIF
jgi:hypothetical protein